jgi:ferritin-like metal-binding protein YciE
MAKEPKLLSDLFHDTLKDIYFAEKKTSPHFRRWKRRRSRPS